MSRLPAALALGSLLCYPLASFAGAGPPPALPAPSNTHREAPPPAAEPKPEPVVEKVVEKKAAPVRSHRQGHTSVHPAMRHPAVQIARSEADRLLEGAEVDYLLGRQRSARNQADRALAQGAGTRAARIYVAASCFLKDVPAAMKVWGRLSARDRPFVKYICERAHVRNP